MGAVLVAVMALCEVPAAGQGPVPSTVAAPTERIAYAGTEHRGIGVAVSTEHSDPIFDTVPAHYDQNSFASGDLLVFTSLRDEAKPQVYLRTADGDIRRLTTGMDAAHPHLSPDRRWVAFDAAGDDQRDLWLVRTDGTDLRRLTDTPDNEEWPSFSPDGSEIAYSCDANGNWQVYRTPVSHLAAAQVTNEPVGGAIQPAWNPTDDIIAYTLDTDGNPSTEDDQTIRSTAGPLFTGTRAGWQTRWPVWMPDGRTLLFLSLNHVCGCPGDPEPRGTVDIVYRVQAAFPTQADPVVLLTEDRRVDSPTWLDGKLVVTRTDPITRNVATMQDIRPDGADPRDFGIPVLTEDPAARTDSSKLFDPGDGFDPWTQRQSFSPDGRRIAVSRFETIDGRRVQRIWLTDADGSNAAPLPLADRKPGDWETDAAWSPDGTKVAIARRSPGAPNREGGPGRILIVRVDDGQVLARLRNPDPTADEDDAQPAWSPDGKVLAFSRGTVAGGPQGQPRTQHVWTARADGLDRQRDISAAVCGFACDTTDDSPAFAPDGRTVVFNRENDGLVRVTLSNLGCEVLLPTDQTSCAGPLTAPNGPFQPRDISFSPDGSQAVLTKRRARDPNSAESLVIFDLTTRKLTRLGEHLPGRQKEPTWQLAVDLDLTAPPVAARATVGTDTSVTVTVTNRGPGPSPVTIVQVAVPDGLRLIRLRGACSSDLPRCDLGLLQPGAAVTVTADLAPVGPGTHVLDWTVTGSVLDTRPGDNSDSTLVPVDVPPPPPPPTTPPTIPPPPPPAPAPPPPAGPGVAVVAQPNPSYVGGSTVVTYTVRNTGGSIATGLRLGFGLPPQIPIGALPPGCAVAGCPVPDLAPGATSVTQVLLRPNTPLTATITATLQTTGSDNDRRDNQARTTLRVLLPRIVAVPPIGKPGFVTSVRGEDFPPGAPVVLTWTPGITAAAAPTFPRGDGRFTAQLLILAKDQTGPRVITASGPGFGPVTTPFLVVSGTIAPPGVVSRR